MYGSVTCVSYYECYESFVTLNISVNTVYKSQSEHL